MSSKKILVIIIDKLAEKVKRDSSFECISRDLINKIGDEKYTKEEIVILLKKLK
jgi:hypothetical protein